jgi:hypothetical protein
MPETQAMGDRGAGCVANDRACNGPDRTEHHRARQGSERRIAAAVLICECL